MTEPPTSHRLEAGIHWLCTCGRTSFPPYCDGSHKGSGKQPCKYETREAATILWPPVPDQSQRKEER